MKNVYMSGFFVTLLTVLIYFNLGHQLIKQSSNIIKPIIDKREFGEVTNYHVKNLRLPKLVPRDTSSTFYVNGGTYIPSVDRLIKSNILHQTRCDVKTQVVIAIKSIREDYAKRAVIRNTWGNATVYREYNTKIVFLMGIDITESDEKRRQWNNESDIIVGDFHDSFHNLTYKDSMFLTWAKHSCPTVKHFIKGDSDVLVNPFALDKFIAKRERLDNHEDPLILGALCGGSPPIRVPTSRYGDLIWPGNFYPNYISGGGFYLNRAALNTFQQFIKVTPMIPIDDAFIGVAMERAGQRESIVANWDFKLGGFPRNSGLSAFNPCHLKDVIIYHKYDNMELTCFWPKFAEHYHKCVDKSNYTYVEEGTKCDSKREWYRNKTETTDPIVDTNAPNWRRCGPHFNNARCSVDPTTWTGRHSGEMPNGPCCSGMGNCGATEESGTEMSEFKRLVIQTAL